MKYRILWPGKTKNLEIRKLQDFYLSRINFLESCEVIQTKEAKGIDEKYSEKIKEIEAEALEKHFKDNYIICLSDGGKELSSLDFARVLKDLNTHSTQVITFVVGGFLGLSKRIVDKADFIFSFSKMTFSHELSRLLLLEQMYRALTIIRGKQYAK